MSIAEEHLNCLLEQTYSRDQDAISQIGAWLRMAIQQQDDANLEEIGDFLQNTSDLAALYPELYQLCQWHAFQIMDNVRYKRITGFIQAVHTLPRPTQEKHGVQCVMINHVYAGAKIRIYTTKSVPMKLTESLIRPLLRKHRMDIEDIEFMTSEYL